jgi:hypothetical protein
MGENGHSPSPQQASAQWLEATLNVNVFSRSDKRRHCPRQLDDWDCLALHG